MTCGLAACPGILSSYFALDGRPRGVDTDLQALQKTTRLMEYFSEITAAFERDPLRDILSDEAGAPDLIIWLDRLPDGVKLVLNSHDDVVLRIRPERFMPEPLPPEVLFGWIDSEQPRGVEGPEPGLRAARGEVDSPDGHVQPRAEVLHAFTRWHSQWTSWRRDQRRIQARRALYENLEQAAKTLEQHDDEYELVLGLGLLRWQAPDGEADLTIGPVSGHEIEPQNLNLMPPRIE